MPREKVDNFALIRKRLANQASAPETTASIFPANAAPVSVVEGPTISLISPRFLRANPYQKRVDEGENIDSLVESMRTSGFMGALVARVDPDDHRYYQLAYGHRRRLAAEMVGIDVPTEIRDLTNQEMLFAAIRENNAREDLSDLEWGDMFWQMDREGMTQEEIMRAVGVGTNNKIRRGYVQERIALAKLAGSNPQIRAYLVAQPTTPIRAMRSLDGLDDSQITVILEGMRSHDWTVDQIEQRVGILKEGGVETVTPGRTAAEITPSVILETKPTAVVANPPAEAAAVSVRNLDHEHVERVGRVRDRSLLVKASAKELRKYVDAVKQAQVKAEDFTDAEVGVLTDISIMVHQMLTILGLDQLEGAQGHDQ